MLLIKDKEIKLLGEDFWLQIEESVISHSGIKQKSNILIIIQYILSSNKVEPELVAIYE